VTDLIELVGAVDGILRLQSAADCDYFLAICGRSLSPEESDALRATVLAAYRWQYIVSGAQEPRFTAVLADLITEPQAQRVGDALAPIVGATVN
jgi:hypothetical protein